MSTIGGLGLLLLTPFQANETEAQQFYQAPSSHTHFSHQTQHSIPLTGFSYNTQTVTRTHPIAIPHKSIQRFETGCGPICVPQTTYELGCLQTSRTRVSGINYDFCDSIGAPILGGIGDIIGGTLQVAGEGVQAIGNGIGSIGHCIDNKTDICEPRGYFHPHLNRPAPICPPVNPCPQPYNPCPPTHFNQPTRIHTQTIHPRPQIHQHQPHQRSYQVPTPKKDCGCD